MSGAWGFITVFAAAFLLWLVMHRFGTPRTRALLDRLANAHKAAGQDRVAQIGETGPDRDLFGQVLMPLTIGVRVISTVAVIALLYLLNMHSEDAAFSPIPPQYFWEGYMVASALASWYMGYIWTYQLRLDGARLIVPTWGFRCREYDLRELVRIEDDGAYILRLYFDDGGKAEIIKYVRGRPELMNTLEEYAVVA